MIQQFFRAVCAGPCGRWLLVIESGAVYDDARYTTVAYPDTASAFPSLVTARKSVAAAGWRGDGDAVCPPCQNRTGCKCRSRTKTHRTDCPSYTRELTS